MIRRTKADTVWRDYRDFLLQRFPGRERRAFGAWFKTFYQFQLEWLCEPERFAVCNKSRQTGFSHTTGGLATLWGVAFGETTTLISLAERDSKEVLDKARAHAGLLRDFGSEWARISGKDSAEEVRFASGGRLIALPQTSGGRGFSGNVFIDEYAHLERPEKVWNAASAVTLHGYRMRVAATPNGTGNPFHALCTNPKQNKGWAYHEIPLSRALDDGMRVDINACWKMAKGDPRIFDELFNCKFLDGSLQYIPNAAVTACTTDDLYTYEGEYYAGLDIGRTADLTALAIVRKTQDGVARLQCLLTCKRTDEERLHAFVAYAFSRRYEVRRLCVDSSGLGAFPAEEMQRQYGQLRVEPVVFTQKMKEELATGMHTWFSQTMVRIPADDEALPDGTPGAAELLRNDICSIKREITPAGNVRYDAPHTNEGHADTAWALALALHACGKPPSIKIVDESR